MGLTSINDRLTPSVPIEITFGAQLVASGRKITTLIGHRAAAGGSAVDYYVHDMVNVGDPALAKSEVEALAGSASQIAKMAEAFVKANSQVSVSRNFPAFRIVILPNAELHFGTNQEALEAIKFLRSDMIVSCYPASDDVNEATLLAFAQLISGVDRDLQGQFGSFITLGSIDALATAIAYGLNNRQVIVAYLQDTNTAAVIGVTGDTTLGSNVISDMSSTEGINQGAEISGTGIPAGAVVESVGIDSVTISELATSTNAAEALTIQNVISQAAEIIAAAHAAAMMQSAFPYNPLQGVQIGGLVPPRKLSDRIDINPNGASEQALVNGLSPLYIQPGNTVGFIRSRTTYNLLPDNVTPANSYLDWQDLVLLNDFKEACYGVTQNPPFNNNPGGTKASQQIAALLKDEILREAQDFEDRGAFQGVQTLAPLFLVQPSTTMRGRFDFKIPVNVIPGLYVIAGNIQAVTGLGDFTL